MPVKALEEDKCRFRQKVMIAEPVQLVFLLFLRTSLLEFLALEIE